MTSERQQQRKRRDSSVIGVSLWIPSLLTPDSPDIFPMYHISHSHWSANNVYSTAVEILPTIILSSITSLLISSMMGLDVQDV